MDVDLHRPIKVKYVCVLNHSRPKEWQIRCWYGWYAARSQALCHSVAPNQKERNQPDRAGPSRTAAVQSIRVLEIQKSELPASFASIILGRIASRTRFPVPQNWVFILTPLMSYILIFVKYLWVSVRIHPEMQFSVLSRVNNMKLVTNLYS